jgi:hypothetical protein
VYNGAYMTESFKNAETSGSVEELKSKLEAALGEVGRNAAAVGQYEAGKPEADFGMADDLLEAEKAATEVFGQLLEAIKARGTSEGVDRQTGELDFRVG